MKIDKKPRWKVRLMEPEDIDQCLNIWSRVELTEARSTVSSCLAADPEGFYVAELLNESSTSMDDNEECSSRGKIVGMCSGLMTRYDTAFIGFYGVEPELQGIGIGRELWTRCLNRLDQSINIGLYGVPSMTDKYKRTGFKLEDSIRMIIYESEPNKEQELNLDNLKSFEELKSNSFGTNLELEEINKSTDEVKLRKLIEYDQLVHRYSREKLLKLYLAGNDIPLTVAIIRRTSASNITAAAAAAATAATADNQQQDQAADWHQVERKLSCCAKPSQEAIIEDETLSTTIKSSLSISSNNLGELHPRSSSPIDIPSVCCTASSGPVSASASAPAADESFEIIGYGCIRTDNNSGGIIGPIYADSSDLCEVILRNLLKRFHLAPGKIYSVMALNSNKQASKIMLKLGLKEIDQCTRMFTKFIPTATFSKIYYVHSPNFTLV